jgi:hypothetical protein
MDEMRPRPYDRYSAQLFCHHSGNYLTTQVGIEHDRLPKVRAEMRREAQAHVNTVGREVEITFYLTLERRVWFTPKAELPS